MSYICELRFRHPDPYWLWLYYTYSFWSYLTKCCSEIQSLFSETLLKLIKTLNQSMWIVDNQMCITWQGLRIWLVEWHLMISGKGFKQAHTVASLTNTRRPVFPTLDCKQLVCLIKICIMILEFTMIFTWYSGSSPKPHGNTMLHSGICWISHV